MTALAGFVEVAGEGVLLAAGLTLLVVGFGWLIHRILFRLF